MISFLHADRPSPEKGIFSKHIKSRLSAIFTKKMKNNFYFLCMLILFTSSCYSHKVLETSDKETYLEVEQAINNYFTGRKTANIQLLQNTFHSESRLMTMDTTLVLISRDEYLDVVQKKRNSFL